MTSDGPSVGGRNCRLSLAFSSGGKATVSVLVQAPTLESPPEGQVSDPNTDPSDEEHSTPFVSV